MKQPNQTVELTPEFGHRLRELRKAAGLSQTEVAVLMGRRGKGCWAIVGRLERAETRHPGLGLVADFLKACGASFADVADLVGMEPQGCEPGVEDPGPKRRESRPMTPAEKLAEVRRRANRIPRKRMLEEAFYLMMKKSGMSESLGLDALGEVARYGRRLFAASERSRKARLDARRKLLSAGRVSEDAACAVERLVEEMFNYMAESGDLDRGIEVDAGAVVAGKVKLCKVKRAEERIKAEFQEEIEEWGRKRMLVMDKIRKECIEQKRREGKDEQLAQKYGSVAGMFCGIADETEPGSDERKRRVEEIVDRARDKEGVGRMGEYVFQRWEELKSFIPPKPGRLGRDRRV
jgi:transcriptional regulator with XRE-family HTH domain